MIPQCHVQIQPLRHSLRSQSQSCRPMLIHNNFSENSFEYHPNQNSVTSHQRWKNFMQHRSDKNAKNCSMDLFQDSYCHNTQMQNVRNGFSKGGPVQPPTPGMMRVVEENTGDRVISTSDEEDSYGNVSDTYPLSQETGEMRIGFENVSDTYDIHYLMIRQVRCGLVTRISLILIHYFKRWARYGYVLRMFLILIHYLVFYTPPYLGRQVRCELVW